MHRPSLALRRITLALVALAAALAFVACTGDDAQSDDEIGGELILATTTSTQDSGLLDILVPRFEEDTGVNVKVIAVGTGAALEMARTGDADAVLAHAPDAEQHYIDDGHLVASELVMHNDFVIVGPPDDPARLAGASSIEEAFQLIAATGPFISRGDDSGTHKVELALWETASIDPGSATGRDETGQGMGATLNIADQKRGYTLADRGTFLALRENLDLDVLFEGDEALLNIYHIHLVNPDQHDGINEDQARAWIDFLVSTEAQDIIETFGEEDFGEPLFVPDAGKSIDGLAQ